MLSLGVKAFIQKPIDKNVLNDVLKMLEEPPTHPRIFTPVSVELPILKRRDIYLEVAYVSIGRAADALARHFEVFVQLPLPFVNIFEVCELHMALQDLVENSQVSVCVRVLAAKELPVLHWCY